ncbi:GNAT family N-acetyltransferase [Actinomadura algeriensis]|uniref:GNAT superfamily N-acetyltransferase n=1 Tax=Actinomadura algeriensis TaxID=1679523 RepID=A0ABR9JXS1_9ACTN|nr:GNAT family N-acetyltransferase [Actinomadura algeriensis]MBE1535371.1 GNAT superfamily N-acetyltransferase [Actinomadura algeriensis]
MRDATDVVHTGPMGWTLTRDLDTFLADAGAYMHADPAVHTVALTVTATMRARDPADREDVLFGRWTHGGRVAGIALWTPPRPPLLGCAPDAARELADVLTAHGDVRGVHAAPETAEAFAGAWRRRTGGTTRVAMRQRLYRLGALAVPDPLPPGAARIATAADHGLALDWFVAFHEEDDEHGPVDPAALDDRIATGGLALWETAGTPVAMAARTRIAAAMARVAPVYTPPEHRRRGYGAAVTAAVTRSALDAGAREVVLLTDLANPTSNGVYRRLGYRPVEDRTIFTFAPA